MANFGYAFEKTIKHEGGYNDIKSDAGGATNFGVSLRYLKDLYKIDNWVDIDGDGDIDANDIKNLTLDDAKKIYFEQFWLKQKCDSIASDVVAAKLFDMSVNMGLNQAAKIIQRACNYFGKGLVEDGKLGNASLKAIESIKTEDLISQIRYECVKFYLSLCDKNKDLVKFLNGWLRRAVS